MAELIIALDYSKPADALDMAQKLAGRVAWLKVGLELFISAGPQLALTLKKMGFNVFLDLKLYDIPNTALGAARAIARLGIDMTTIHCQGGRRMCAAVLDGFASVSGPAPLVMGVTSLTSFKSGEMPGICMEPGAYGLTLAEMASTWGLSGVVCAVGEVKSVKKVAPGLLCVCPGIRLQRLANDDQGRVATPKEAVLAGADFLVVGRPVTAAPDPLKAIFEIYEQMDAAYSQA